MTKVHTITTYGIQELSDKAFRYAIDDNREWNLNGCWWDGVYEDAKNIGLKITSSDVDMNHIEGLLLSEPLDVANEIIKEHGPSTDTHRLAQRFIKTRSIGAKADGSAHNDYQDERDEKFKRDLLALYLKMLKDEADYLSEEETICESLEANDTQFLEDGTLAPTYLQ